MLLRGEGKVLTAGTVVTHDSITPYKIPGDAGAEDNFRLMRPFILGDVNRDSKVDAADLAAAFNTKPGFPNWNFAADLNKDGIVNIYDLVLVGRNFGK